MTEARRRLTTALHAGYRFDEISSTYMWTGATIEENAPLTPCGTQFPLMIAHFASRMTLVKPLASGV